MGEASVKQVKYSWWPHIENNKIASFRLRCFQIVNSLQQKGVDASLYRLGDKPDVLVLSKRYDRASVDHALALKRQSGTKLVLDLCDNHFYTESNDPKWLERAQMLRDAISVVDHVVCSTEALANVVKVEVAGVQTISVIGDAAEEIHIEPAINSIAHPAAEVALWNLRRKIGQSGVSAGRRLVWFGNHGSGNASGGLEDLLLIRDALVGHNKKEKIFLTVISNSKNRYQEVFSDFGIDNAYLNWHYTTFSRALQLHDIAVIPVKLNPFTICKTNNRVASSLKHGLAVAATQTPAYASFADFACFDDWIYGLAVLMNDEHLRKVWVEKGQKYLAQNYSLPSVVEQWLTALQDATEPSIQKRSTSDVSFAQRICE